MPSDVRATLQRMLTTSVVATGMCLPLKYRVGLGRRPVNLTMTQVFSRLLNSWRRRQIHMLCAHWCRMFAPLLPAVPVRSNPRMKYLCYSS
ncbi:hypothetical protein HBI56_152840 [Parastagonospora nodorum]|uniref:Uncharacterized protein n=1 Tax=Phaeosphaeria nodorum (strain SN15 / ATCC MYA-4574 / FGSC 10173) TaxID=321614 RepID=A0A7U2FJ55_PHANO|nr:hypothetical protein HBH56_181670 [Parastagonospora nodorum]QRD04255.1 hypothetical protein JI435_129890 [Parastagonospora nodorum SN15]KAH3926005.1 hypothetical protein HBH54_170820 [Parastagonospora nodorum]KAH3944813.1 hypothetical protein HBH53_154100 [Parastagonospora nodorum]KAH3960635.1 hypothetical protein HBH52_235900 [Parastagonospora nodorum]